MTKWLQWTAKLMIGTMLISGLTLCFTWLTIRTYVDKLLTAYQIDVPDTGLADLFGFGGSKNAADGTLPTALPEASAPSPGTGAAGATPSATPANADITGASPSPGSSGSPGSALGGAEEGGGPGASPGAEGQKDRVQSLGSAGTSSAGASLAMTSQQLVDLKERMSETDKAQMIALLTKMPESVLQQLTALLEDGLTAAELARMKEESLRYLSQAEYGQLLNILNKYE